ncbi:MAG: hypothetical protein ACMG6E_00140 [Candidatus Roizmanbacteria bacterium]
MAKYPNATVLEGIFLDLSASIFQDLTPGRATSNAKFMTTVANLFSNRQVACNHRIPQKEVFALAVQLGADSVLASTIAQKLCSYVDLSQCGNTEGST